MGIFIMHDFQVYEDDCDLAFILVFGDSRYTRQTCPFFFNLEVVDVLCGWM